jgi:hypothetical protein
MASGVSFVWVVTWALWGAVVYKDWRSSLGDRRWLGSLAALVVLAAMTRGSFVEFDLRAGLLIAIAVAILGIWSVADMMAARRRARKEAWARSAGFEPVALAPAPSSATLPDGLRRLPMLGLGRSPRTDGVLRRESRDGGELFVFDHAIRRRVIWYDANGVDASGTVVAIRRPDVCLPLFQVRPIGLFAWMDGGSVGDAVPLPSGTAFAKSYRLGGHEPRNLRTLFSDDLLALIGEKPGWLIEGEGEWLAAFVFDRSPNLMSLKTSTLRSVRVGGLEAHVREVERLLENLADRASRSSRREVGAA